MKKTSIGGRGWLISKTTSLTQQAVTGQVVQPPHGNVDLTTTAITGGDKSLPPLSSYTLAAFD